MTVNISWPLFVLNTTVLFNCVHCSMNVFISSVLFSVFVAHISQVAVAIWKQHYAIFCDCLLITIIFQIITLIITFTFVLMLSRHNILCIIFMQTEHIWDVTAAVRARKHLENKSEHRLTSWEIMNFYDFDYFWSFINLKCWFVRGQPFIHHGRDIMLHRDLMLLIRSGSTAVCLDQPPRCIHFKLQNSYTQI